MKTNRHALVFGASGFIGRWLTKELLDQRIPTTAALRNINRLAALRQWLADRGTNVDLLDAEHADLASEEIGLSGPDFSHVSEIYNVAGAYAFGMSPDTAHAANVETSRRVVEFAATIPGVRRIHLSGYRVGGQDPKSVPWSEQKRKQEYKRLGAYESFPGCRALERSLPEQSVHEGADIHAEGGPEGLIVGLEDGPACSPEQTFLKEQRESAHWQVFPLAGYPVGAL